jgi:hypothetical protein
MRLDINVLWFEDAFAELAAGVARLKRHLKQQGYGLEIKDYGDTSSIDELATRQKLGHEFDLIVVDYNLLNGALGTDVAVEVRELFRFTRIVFYSGQFDRKGLMGLMADKGVEGVFCEERGSIVDRLQEIMDTIVADNNRLAGMRGLAAEVVGKCDDHLRNALKHIAQLDHDKAYKKLMEKAKSSGQDALSKLDKCKTFDELLACRGVTSMHLYMATKSLSKGLVGPEFLECLALYEVEALGIRNSLSHAVQELYENGSWKLGGESGLSMADFPTLRTNFRKHLVNCEAVAGIVSAHVAKEAK